MNGLFPLSPVTTCPTHSRNDTNLLNLIPDLENLPCQIPHPLRYDRLLSFDIFICLYLLGHGGPLCSRYKKSLLLFSGYGNPFMVQDMEILALIETLSLFRIWKSLFVSFWDMEIPSSFRIWKSSCLSGYGDPALIKRLDMEILCVLRDIICIWNPWHSWRIRKSLRCDTSRLELAQPSVKSAYHSSLQDTMPLSFYFILLSISFLSYFYYP